MCKALKEWSTADLIAGQSDPNFLRSAERVRQLRKYGTEYAGLRGMSVYFRTKSSEFDENRTVWTQEIKLLDLPEALGIPNMTLKDKVEYARKGDVLVRCDCPAFLYWGFAYQLLQLDAAVPGQYYGGWSVPGKVPTKPGLYPDDVEGNPPYYIGKRRRNWMLINTLCKHLMFVLKEVFQAHWNSIMADLKKQGYE